MKATEIFNQSIVAHNPAIDDSLDPKVIESLCAHNDRLSYDYERLYNSGKLLRRRTISFLPSVPSTSDTPGSVETASFATSA